MPKFNYWVAIYLASTSLIVNATTLDIAVVVDGVAIRKPCDFNTPNPCEAHLLDVVNLIQQPEWQHRLVGRFDTVRIEVSEGVFRLEAPLTLRWGNTDTSNIGLEILGQGTGVSSLTTIISGAKLLQKLIPSDKVGLAAFDLAEFNAFERPPVRGFGQPIRPVTTELFQGDKVLHVAGWPNDGYGRIDRRVTLPEDDHTTFSVQGKDSAGWKSEPDLRVFAYWFYDWAAQTFVAKVLPEGQLVLAGTGSHYGIKTGQRLRIENALSELDAPGEWYLDRANMRLYVSPLAGTTAPYELSIAIGLLEIEDSRNVTIRNIAFEKTRGDAISVRNSDNVVLDTVSIRNTGNRALVVDGGRNCGVRNALIEHNGEGGVTLSGGTRTTLEHAGHFLERSTIRDFSRLSKTLRMAAELNGVGQQVLGNVISDAPHTAILFTGNDHLIAGNEIFSVVKETSDAGAIYTGRDLTARGTVIENNFLHDIQADSKGREVKGVYLDDQASGITVRNNVFAHVQQPVFIGGGRDNIVEGNVFYDSSPSIHLDARGLQNGSAESLDPKGTLQIRLDAVPYRSELWAARYPHMATIRDDSIGAPKYNLVQRNVVVKGKPFAVHTEAVAGVDLGGIAEQGEDVFAKPVPGGGRARREDFDLRVD
jgi:hypothetical protein